MNEEELYVKVMGIEEARKANLPMPNGIKIPKSARLSSSSGYCNICGQNTVEGHEDGHGIWHYKCTYCVTHQKPDPNPCPRCRCTVHSDIVSMSFVSSLKEGLKTMTELGNPFKPIATIFRCVNCDFEWYTPEYEKYLLTKVVRSILPTSEFAKNEKGK
jgi:hypothetical protein